MKYVVLVRNHPYNEDRCSTEEFNGTTEEARDYFARMVYYGGDAEARACDYVRDQGAAGATVHIISENELIEANMSEIHDKHMKWHDADESKKTELKERRMLAALREKYPE